MSASAEEVARQWKHVNDRDAERLERTGDYRVLRRYQRPTHYRPRASTDVVFPGLVVDCETTGLDVEQDRVMEVALYPFHFDAAGRVYDVLEPIAMLEDPGVPIPPEIVELTGITDEKVKHCRFDEPTVEALVSAATLVIAHNAGFDRPMLERRFPVFVENRWACSYRDVPWRRFGIRSGSLDYILAAAARAYHEEHRATTDCESTLHALAAMGPEEKPYLSYLLDAVRQPTMRVMPVTPYEARAALKARGYMAQYREGKFRYWYRDVAPADLAAEEEWLCRSAGAEPNIPVRRITARERYSVRA